MLVKKKIKKISSLADLLHLIHTVEGTAENTVAVSNQIGWVTFSSNLDENTQVLRRHVMFFFCWSVITVNIQWK